MTKFNYWFLTHNLTTDKPETSTWKAIADAYNADWFIG